MDGIRIAVIGGGASGMAAALAAARAGAKVTLWEQNERVGRKLLATGNGKCNFSNLDMGSNHYYGGDTGKAERLMQVFGVQETIELFEGLGMLVKQKNGYLYPLSEQASTVLDILRMALEQMGVDIRTGQAVKDIRQDVHKSGYFITVQGREHHYDKVIVACGGQASPQTGSDGSGYCLAQKLGETLVPIVPALVQLRCEEKPMKAVAGVRTEAEITLVIDGREEARETGELQLTDYGISGIVVFQLSRHAAYALREGKTVKARINCLPGMAQKEYESFTACRLREGNGKSAEVFFTGMLNKKLMAYFMAQAGLKPQAQMSGENKRAAERVFALCRKWELTVSGTNSFDNAQVCAGGVSMEAISDNLESLKHPGLYYTGELLDVDGKCGGYNLQWAWTSGYLAGSHAAGGGIIKA